MKKTLEPIVFFGSGPVASESLKLLAQSFAVEAVITKPRQSHHKGDVPVLKTAEELKLKVYTVAKKSELDELIDKGFIKSRCGILIDFGIIISQKVIDYFPKGIINSHFSILPELRGADPITFAILSGQKQTGVSIMFLVEKMDEGPILGYGKYDMSQNITATQLTKDLIQLSYELLQHEVPKWLAGESRGNTPQSITGRKISYSRKLTKADGDIDWKKSAVQLDREVRAFIEWPKSRTRLGSIEVVITQAHVIDTQGEAGSIKIINKELVVNCGDQSLVIDTLKPAGKKEMSGKAFLAGYKDKIAASITPSL
jgi:methionyl-tRNA formyltransferase